MLPKQWKELKNLINQPNIVTKEAEKGGQSQLLVNTIIGQLFNTLTIKTNNRKYIHIWQYREKKRKLLNKHKMVLTGEFKHLNEVD